jgi:DNA topoisomerase-3
MNGRLIIAEKPSVAVSIANIVGATTRKDGYLEGNGYIVSWCYGHLVGQSPPEVYGEAYNCPPYAQDLSKLPLIPQTWQYEIVQTKPRKGESKADAEKRNKNNESTKRQFNTVKSLLNSADEIICATDAGREGELIFRNVYNLAGCRKPFKRLWISSLEDVAIRDGLRKLRDGSDFDALFRAGECRAKADWLVGMNGSRLFSTLYKTNLSIGRVQTPTLAMIVERNFKVTNFVKEKYYTVDLNCPSGASRFIASTERIDSYDEALRVLKSCVGKSATVINLEKETKTENPPKLYDLTTLQREANRLFSFSAQETLDATQKLYEKKLVTYPRTDSQFITDDMRVSTLGIVNTILQNDPLYSGLSHTPNIDRVINNAKVSDHHAILPMAEYFANKERVQSLSESELSIFMLIVSKLICATAERHVYSLDTAILICGDHTFTAKGKNVLETGWKQIEKIFKKSLKTQDDADKNQKKLQRLNVDEGKVIEYPEKLIAEHQTSPPNQYTEDTLLSAMETAGNKDYVEGSDTEKRGIGTPATRASVIELLLRKGFIVRQKKNLLPTEKGINLIKIVPESVKSAKLTADWETALQNIEKGKANASGFMDDITAFTRRLVAENMMTSEAAAEVFNKPRDVVVIGKCPKCGGDVVEIAKINAYSCSKSKEECGFILWKKQFGKDNALTVTQAKKLLDKGKTDKIKGFVSKAKGTTYDAFLVLKADFSVGMEF